LRVRPHDVVDDLALVLVNRPLERTANIHRYFERHRSDEFGAIGADANSERGGLAQDEGGGLFAGRASCRTAFAHREADANMQDCC